MRSTEMFMIDKSKLMHAIKSRGLTVTKCSAEMGRSSTYLTKSIYAGKITTTTALLLSNMYGINRDEYEISQAETHASEPSSPAVEKELATTIDYDLLYSTIYGAILAALRRHARELTEG